MPMIIDIDASLACFRCPVTFTPCTEKTCFAMSKPTRTMFISIFEFDDLMPV